MLIFTVGIEISKHAWLNGGNGLFNLTRPSLPSRVLLSIRRSFGATKGGVLSFAGVAVVLSIRDIVFKNNNQCNNDNHYHQTTNLRQAFL